MPALNPIALAVPFFLLLMAVELLVARRRGLRPYRLQDALCDLGCGMGQQAVLALAAGGLAAAYAALYAHRLLTPAPALAWVIGFVGVDLTYYFWHRASHEVNVLWAAHAVHHQSEDYNLAVALRQGAFTAFTSLPFGLPLALLGVPPLAYATWSAVSLLYQFWIHTELVGRLGWVERVLNTPSHHRVHHAVNPRYLDRNYGAILIVWDRLFGSFAEERERPVYGLTHPLGSFDPVRAQLRPWADLARQARALPRWRDRARAWLASPAWSPTGEAPPPEEVVQARPRFEVPVTARVRRYAAAQFALLVAGTTALMLVGPLLPAALLAAAAALVLLGLAGVGALLDGRRWAPALEAGRVAATLGAVAWWVIAR